MKLNCLITVLLTFTVLAGCSSSPGNVADVCDIFDARRSWYKAARETRNRWGVPVGVSMAFIYQESGFKSRARPPRNRFLWIFPGSRPSTAYGFAQAVDGTWQDYIDQSGNLGARRNRFADAMDFIGWYNAMTHRINRVPLTQAGSLYLAYHEGNRGFSQKTYLQKDWLINVSRRVQNNAEVFQAQYSSCREDLDKPWIFRVFS